MTSKILSATVNGFNADLIEVECDIHAGMPAFTIVGLGDTSVQESRERIKSAIKNSGCQYPQTKKIINLAPANLRKHGPLFDVPIALAILVQSGQLSRECLVGTVAVGELALDGGIRKISGALALAECALKNNCTRIIVPKSNLREAALITGIECVGVEHLFELIGVLRGEIEPTRADMLPPSGSDHSQRNVDAPLLDDLDGHEQAKRALIIAVAGAHHLLMYGAPGAGKSTLAQVLATLMPRLTHAEALETTKLYSIAGLLDHHRSLIEVPPFRTVHQSTPSTALIGGGALATPGEISLAHNGVLFADELLEFPQPLLDMLRQPLETGVAVVSRLSGTVTFPAQSLFVGATNPCPCGFWGDEERRCTCLPSRREKYLKKLSGPLLDRIDLIVHVPRVQFAAFSSEVLREKKKSAKQTIAALKQICIARSMQNRRGILNGRLSRRHVDSLALLTPEAQKIVDAELSRGLHSGRTYVKVIRLARTIADLEEKEQVQKEDVAEALSMIKCDKLT